MSEADIVLTGEPDDDAGWTLLGPGDLDGNTREDLLVGLPRVSGEPGPGRVAWYPGPVPTGTSALADAPTVFIGDEDASGTGYSLAAGDFDGDGVPDLAIGAPYRDGDGTNRGAVFVVFGPLPAGAFVLDGADALLVGTIDGEVAGTSVATAGDVDGNGVDDLVVGAPAFDTPRRGRACLFYGPLTGSARTLDEADAIFDGAATSNAAGGSVLGPGDLDGDGYGDLVIGAPYNDDFDTDSGKAYVAFGGGM